MGLVQTKGREDKQVKQQRRRQWVTYDPYLTPIPLDPNRPAPAQPSPAQPNNLLLLLHSSSCLQLTKIRTNQGPYDTNDAATVLIPPILYICTYIKRDRCCKQAPHIRRGMGRRLSPRPSPLPVVLCGLPSRPRRPTADRGPLPPPSSFTLAADRVRVPGPSSTLGAWRFLSLEGPEPDGQRGF